MLMHACPALRGTEFSIFMIPKVPVHLSWGQDTAPRPTSYRSFPWTFDITQLQKLINKYENATKHGLGD